MTAAKPKRRPEKLLLRVQRGGFAPADGYTQSRLRARGFRVGDEVLATLHKTRRPKFHRLVHAFGLLLVENVEAFRNLDGHTVLKRLQVEGNIGCDEIGIIFPGIGPCTYRIPRSLSYEQMDDAEFTAVFRGFTQHVIATYWPGMTHEQIEEMAKLIGEQ